MRFRSHQNLVNYAEIESKKTADNDICPVYFNIVQYDELYYDEHRFDNLNDLNQYLSTTSCQSQDYCTWLNIEGIHRTDILDDLSIRFNIHNLTKEDILTINERMKFDLLDNGSTIYLLLKSIYRHPDYNHIQQEQISFILKENNLLITFQESRDPLKSYDIFSIIKHRLKTGRGRIRSLKTDYLFYCLFDILVENYMIVLDSLGIKIDDIDKLLMNKLNSKNNYNIQMNYFNFETLKLIYHIKHDMLCFRILCQPLREIIIKLQKAQDRISMANQNVLYRRQYRRKKRPKHIVLSGNYFFNPTSDNLQRRWSFENEQNKAPIFNEYIFMYFKDLNDHIIQLLDGLDTYCDLLSSLVSFYVLLNDADMNRIMTFLTLVSLIFIPLTFITGSFSMNYDNMPPLRWHYTYFLILAVLAFITINILAYFKWKKLF